MIALAIARLTAADGLRNPATWAVTGASAVLLGAATVFGMFTFDVEDRLRLLATAGLATATLHALFLACLLAIGAIRAELESRIALTLFAHPVRHGTWLCGKVLGVWAVVLGTLLPLALLHAGLLWGGWRTGFEPDRVRFAFDANAHLPLAQTMLAHVLVAMQAAVFATMASVAALRVSLLAALALLSAVFVAGNAVAAAGLPGLVVIPALSIYQIDEAVQGFGAPMGPLYLGASLIHTLLVCVGWILLGLALFRDRDLP